MKRATAIAAFCSPVLVVATFTTIDIETHQHVAERLSAFLKAASDATGGIAALRRIDGFENGLSPADRESFQKQVYARLTQNPGLNIYAGLEDGTMMSYTLSITAISYKEPGEAYDVITRGNETMLSDPRRVHNYMTCLEENGKPKPCTLEEGMRYIECPGGECHYIPCPDEQSQNIAIECEGDRSKCRKGIKWCLSYIRRTMTGDAATTAETDSVTGIVTTIKKGFVPTAYSCLNPKGQATESEGQAVLISALNPVAINPDDPNKPVNENILGTCKYTDGATPVRDMRGPGPYAACGVNADTGDYNVCSGTFKGVTTTTNYDPRYRIWYEIVRNSQNSTWSRPYSFFAEPSLGITFGRPIYTQDEAGRETFYGIIAADYTLGEISFFLQKWYGNRTGNLVAVMEEDDQHYFIGMSTGRSPSLHVMKDNHTKPCLAKNGFNDRVPECEYIRLSAEDLDEDDLLRLAFESQRDNGFPEGEFVIVKKSSELLHQAHKAQVTTYREGNISWKILVVTPIPFSSSDALTFQKSALSSTVVILIGVVGFIVCLALFVVYFRKRHERAMVNSDYHFTLSFLGGCVLLNLATFSLLGENNESNCINRMWSYYLLFSITLSPLLVKVYRMFILSGKGAQPVRVTITNSRAALYTLPLILAQFIILMVFSFVDPPKPTERIYSEELEVSQSIVCDRDGNSFFIFQTVFASLIIGIGCTLSYLTRNIDPRFGEAKQLIFAMYNLSLTLLIIATVTVLVDLTQSSKYMLRAIGVCWSTTIGASAFVLPRLMEVKRQLRQTSVRVGSTLISGLDAEIIRNGIRPDAAVGLRNASRSLRGSMYDIENEAPALGPRSNNETAETVESQNSTCVNDDTDGQFHFRPREKHATIDDEKASIEASPRDRETDIGQNRLRLEFNDSSTRSIDRESGPSDGVTDRMRTSAISRPQQDDTEP